MTDVPTLLAGIKTRAEKATPGSWEIKEDCRDYPSVWHDQEVAFSIGRCADCGVEAEYEAEDAEFIAAARTDVPRLAAAIEAVEAAHPSIDVFEYDDTNGTWKLDADGEQIPAGTFCRTCSDSNVIEEIEDCEYDIAGNYGAVSWPCPTITAVAAALGGGE